MWRRFPTLWILSFLMFAMTEQVQGRDDIPGKGVCRTCLVRGAAHGEEDVVAWREYDSDLYTFCSQPCAETFDAFPEAYVPQPLPRPAPEMVLHSEDQQEIVIGRSGKRALLIDFWATWCAPCLEAMPELEELHSEHGSKGFSVVGISIDAGRKELEKFLRENDIAYPVVHDADDELAWHRFLVAAIPALFLIDGDGRIVEEWRGRVEVDQVRQRVEALLTTDTGP